MFVGIVHTLSLTSLSSVGVSTVCSGSVYLVHLIGGLRLRERCASEGIETVVDRGCTKSEKRQKGGSRGHQVTSGYQPPKPKEEDMMDAFVANVNVNDDSSWCFFVSFISLSLHHIPLPPTVSLGVVFLLFQNTPPHNFSVIAVHLTATTHCHSLTSIHLPS